jgi:hypothetical protein
VYITHPLRTWLRLEGLAALVTATLLYRQGGYSWWLYAALFLGPDLSFLGYLAGSRIGALAYNLAHAYIVPLGVIVAAALGALPWTLATAGAQIWIAHIGFDRALGYGLKYPSGFSDTHLGRIGRPPSPG